MILLHKYYQKICLTGINNRRDLTSAEYILKTVILLVLISLLILLPFSVDKEMLSPTQDGHYFFFMLTGIVISAFLGLYLHTISVSVSWKISWLDVLAASLFLYLTVYLLITWEDAAAFNLLEWFFFGSVYLSVRLLESRMFIYLLLTVMIAGVSQAVYGILQVFGLYSSYHSLFNLTGSFFNPGPFAGFLVCILPIALGTYLFKEVLFNHPWQRNIFVYTSLFCIVTTIVVLPISQSRAAWLAATVSFGYLLLIKSNNKVKLFTKWRLEPKVCAITLIMLVLLSTAIGYGLYSIKKDSANGRLLIWRITINMIADKPLFGHGPDKFSANYMEYQAAYFKSQINRKVSVTADNVKYPFNEVLHVTSELGLVGLLIIVLILIQCFFGSIRHNSGSSLYWTHALRASLLSVITFGFFSYPTEVLPVVVYMVVYLGIIANLKESNLSLERIKSIKLPINKKVISISKLTAFIILLVSLSNGWKLITDRRAAFYTWKEAFELYQLQSYKASVSLYKLAFTELKTNGDFLIHYGKALSMAGSHLEAIKILKLSRNFLVNTISYTTLGDSYKEVNENYLAELAYHKASYMIPARFYPKYLLAKLYVETGQDEKALMVANELLEKNIKIKSTAISEIKEEMQHIINQSSIKDF